MRKPATAATSLAWFVVMGGTFGCLLPYLLGDWHPAGRCRTGGSRGQPACC